MKLFNQNNVSIELKDLFFDDSIDGAVAKIEITNNSENCIDIDLCDIWRDDDWQDFEWVVQNIAPKSSCLKTLYYLASDDEQQSILKFHNDEIRTVTCRICVHESGSYNYSTFGKSNRIRINSLSLPGVAVLPKEEFEIEYDEETLFASTNHYIPFEISKSQTEKTYQTKTFKQELARKIDLFSTPQFNRILMAKYGEIGESRFFDIENMCIYNLGTSLFSKSCPCDIAFSELTKEDIAFLKETFDIVSNRNYYYSYSWISPEQLHNICCSKPLIAKWNSIALRTDIPNTPYRYWLSIREQYEKVDVYQPLEQPDKNDFGIKITLHLPKKVFPAGIMKPILDGIVCAFHQSYNIDNVLLQLSTNDFEHLITNAEKHISLFGRQEYVNTYRGNSIKWNPADERLKFAWISVVEEDCVAYFDGEIYQW